MQKRWIEKPYKLHVIMDREVLIAFEIARKEKLAKNINVDLSSIYRILIRSTSKIYLTSIQK